MHEWVIILCMFLEEKDGGLRFEARDQESEIRKSLLVEVRGSHPFHDEKRRSFDCAQEWKGWGTRLCGMVKILKNLGCAARRDRHPHLGLDSCGT
jgi:hypothetical protein